MSALPPSFRDVFPARPREVATPLPVADILGLAVAYRHCERQLADPFAVSVLSLFAMLHRLHADELLPYATTALEVSRERQGDAHRPAGEGDGWLEAFLISERKVQDTYRAAIGATEGRLAGHTALNRLLRRQRAVLQERLQEVFGEESRQLARFSEDEAATLNPSKGD